MLEIFHYVESPRKCSYLPDETASLEIRALVEMSAEEYAELLERGYRRFGLTVFRPACADCSKCRSVRVPVQGFQPGASDRRILRKNRHIEAELHPTFASSAHVDLFNRYHRFMTKYRGWQEQEVTFETYHRDFVAGGREVGKQWLYYDRDRLVGVALMDQVADAISLVYFFYDPDWRPLSPGTYSILTQLLHAKAAGLRYAYLGYWIEECRSVNYKRRFTPLEVLLKQPAAGESPVWAVF